MGQRHQIYLRLGELDDSFSNAERFIKKGGKSFKNEQTVGIHNQWLYGHSAISSLYRFLKFTEVIKKEEYSPFKQADRAISILDSAYSIDIETGYNSSNIIFETNPQIRDPKDGKKMIKNPQYYGECEDPRNGDNNNGITIIDLADLRNPQYCFMSIGHLQCLHHTKHDREETSNPAYINFKPITVTEWIALHYGDDWAKSTDLDQTVFDRIKFIDRNFDVLKTERLIEIFPKMRADLKGV